MPHEIACVNLMQEEAAMAGPLDMPVHLKARELLPIEDGAGLEVKSLRGSLWITQTGDPEDHIIDGGQSFVLDRPGRTLVTALLGPAVFIVQPGRIAALPELRRAA
jgi:hypothetical protein